jgi:hypothetical protein
MRLSSALAVPLILGVLCSTTDPASSQTDDAKPSKRMHAIVFHGFINADDGYVDLGYRFNIAPAQLLGVFAALGVRPHQREVSVEISPNTFLIKKESRFFASVGLDGSRKLGSRFAAYGMLAAAYTWGEFEGSSTKPDDGWGAVAEGGLEVLLGSYADTRWSLRGGYRYQDLLGGLAQNWASLGFIAEL